MQCEQTNGNGSRCQRRTRQFWDGVPLCDAHLRQVQAGIRPPPPKAGCDMPTHATRRPRWDEVRPGWQMELGGPYGWCRVTKVEPVPTPIDGIPRVRIHFLSDAGERPQQVHPVADPIYPYRKAAA